MKVFRLIGMALLAIVISVVVAACSSDDNKDLQTSQDLLGTWKCTSTTPYDKESDAFDIGARIKILPNGKCFIAYHADDTFWYGDGYGDNPTESDWDPEDGDRWLLNDHNFTVMESDLDRWIGTVTIKGNEMTFTYKYQDWNYDKNAMVSESKYTYTSKFILTKRN